MGRQSGKINIGIVCSPGLGGSGVVGSELAKFLAKSEKYKVVFIGEKLPFRLEKGEVVFHKVEKLEHALFTHPLKETALTQGIVDAAIKYKLDILHAHFAIPFAYCAIQAREILKKRGFNISVVTTLHGTDVINLGYEVPDLMKYVLEESDVVTAVSMDLAERAKNLFRPRKDIQVIYNFIDFKSLPAIRNNNSFRSKFASNEEYLFVHVSNFRRVKRVTDTLRVFSKVNATLPSSLLFVGEGPDLATAKKLAKSLNKEHKIHFMGSVKSPRRYLQIADGLIITSEYESFGLAALEAMAHGVPVFSSKAGGIPEVVKNGKSGFLAKPGDNQELSEIIKKHFLSGEEKIEKLKKEAVREATEFDADKIISAYQYLYERLKFPRFTKLFLGSEKI